MHNPFFSLHNDNYTEEEEQNPNGASLRFPQRMELSSFGKGRKESRLPYNTDTLTTELGADDRSAAAALPEPLSPTSATSTASARAEAEAVSAYEATVQSASTFL